MSLVMKDDRTQVSSRAGMGFRFDNGKRIGSLTCEDISLMFYAVWKTKAVSEN